ncbi:hypothetical protein GOODEAATRI_000731, partial [Goodea atripinnis]
ETPPGLPWPHPNLGIAAAVCASAFKASQEPLLLFYARSEPRVSPATWHEDSARCSECTGGAFTNASVIFGSTASDNTVRFQHRLTSQPGTAKQALSLERPPALPLPAPVTNTCM